MSDTVLNIAKGRLAYYAGLPAANDALKAVPLETSGLESDATIQDYDTVAAILAASTNEQSTIGRKTLSSVTVTVDDTNNRVDIDCADVTWTAATGNAVSRLLVFYVPDTTSESDSTNIPLVLLDCVFTPAGGDVTYSVNSAGFARAS